jgi:periplasmic mercuric ion binding protein
MCKNNIEKAAKAAGARYANWSEETHVLTVKYTKKDSRAAIQQKIAAAGYDNEGAKATQASYDRLHGCCKYDRNAAPAGITEQPPVAAAALKACCKEKLEKGEAACCMPETAKMHGCCRKSIAAGKEACCKQ